MYHLIRNQNRFYSFWKYFYSRKSKSCSDVINNNNNSNINNEKRNDYSFGFGSCDQTKYHTLFRVAHLNLILFVTNILVFVICQFQFQFQFQIVWCVWVMTTIVVYSFRLFVCLRCWFSFFSRINSTVCIEQKRWISCFGIKRNIRTATFDKST